uniref:Hydroxymethylglutaryl-CoA synthase n=1 Tax=Plectus sambesii TaxID=2011161 RepID=A0A914VMD5_9BILA
MAGSVTDVGIHAMEVYFPRLFVDQTELELFDGASAGKYTVGLGQMQMGFCADHEDVQSIMLTVTAKLMEKHNIDPKSVGFLAVGTETIVDKSKSVKTQLMQLFPGNGDIEGVDVTNACFGGTQAVFHAVDWVYANVDGSRENRWALAVMGDIAVYDKGPARCTGGAGAVALLIGPNAPLVFDRGLRAVHMQSVYDFYKPRMTSEYPVVDGALSVQSYLSALDACYQLYGAKYAKITNGKHPDLSNFAAVLFHSPYARLVQKSLGRLAFHDFVSGRHSHLSSLDQLSAFRGTPLNATYGDKSFEKAVLTASEQLFRAKTDPSLLFARRIGNMYTGSLYGGLCSLLLTQSPSELVGRRLLLFSYGSGSAAAIFSLSVSTDASRLQGLLQSAKEAAYRLDHRVKASPKQFARALEMREQLLGKAPYQPHALCMDDNDGEGMMHFPLFPDTFYLTQIDEKFRRRYERSTNVQQNGH